MTPATIFLKKDPWEKYSKPEAKTPRMNTRKSADELLDLLQKRKALLFNNQLEI